MAWLPKKSVVVPVDFSDDSFAALDTALQLVGSPSGVHVVHVLPTFEPNDLESIWVTIDPAAREEHTVKALNERLAKQGVNGVSVHVVFGEAGHAIADFAKAQNAELVVLPSHGRTGITRVLIGSTAERVVRLCHCPVLVLRK
jgi:nucleotide-binding universal stress UspA family protein